MYIEQVEEGNLYREGYLRTLEHMVENRQKKANEKRILHFQEMISDPDLYRDEFKEMLGWPLTAFDEEPPVVNKKIVNSESDMNIYRIVFDMPIGIKFYGMLFEHKNQGKLPLVIAQHGKDGTPELCSGLLDFGSTNYNDMVIRVYNKGANVFVPQLLLWNSDFYGINYNRIAIDSKLKQLGSSITAVEIYCIMKSINYLRELDTVEKSCIGMIGLSYGGFYTLFTTAVDTRIKAAITCSQYNDRYKYAWEDWVWFNSANKFLDNEVVGLVFPRYIGIYVGKNDEVFDYKLAENECEKLKNMLGDDWFDFHVFDGTHEFIKDDVYLDNFFYMLKNRD